MVRTTIKAVAEFDKKKCSTVSELRHGVENAVASSHLVSRLNCDRHSLVYRYFMTKVFETAVRTLAHP